MMVLLLLSLKRKKVMIKLGIIKSTQGVKGDLYLSKYIDINVKKLKFTKVTVGFSEKFSKEFIVEKFEENNKGYIIKLDKIDTKEQAQDLKEQAVFIEENIIDDNDYFSNPFILKDFKVISNNDNSYIGIVEDIIINSVNNLLVIKSEKGDILIPFINNFINDVDSAKQIIRINIIPGLLDLNT